MAELDVRRASPATGWGGRLADTMARSTPAAASRSSRRSTAPCCSRPASRRAPLAIPVSGSFALAGYQRHSAASNARLAALQAVARGRIAATRSSTRANAIGTQALALSATVNPILANTNSTVAPIFAALSDATRRAGSCYQVAKTDRGARRDRREAPDLLRLARQLRHAREPAAPTQPDLLAAALAGAEGVLRRDRRARRREPGDDVHAVRLRPHVPARLRRGHRPRVGQPPLHPRRRGARAATSTASIRRSRSAARTTRSSEGRWIPTTSVDQYGATLAQWFGVHGGRPRVGVSRTCPAFATSDLGFMA